jgi:hypothetical protein
MADAAAAQQQQHSDAENRAANAEPASTADKAGGEAAAPPAGPPPKKATKVPQQKFNNVKVRTDAWRTLLPERGKPGEKDLFHLVPPRRTLSTLPFPNHPSAPCLLPRPAPHPPQNLLVMRLQQVEAESAARQQEADADELVGSRQRDLLEWYFRYMVERWAAVQAERRSQREQRGVHEQRCCAC